VTPAAPSLVLGRYALYEPIASGGMATVHFGRLLGPVGFSRTVAIKRLHPQFASDPEFVSMFLDEAHLAAHIRHPNVAATLDVVALEGELFLVMDYVQGESLSKLIRAARHAGEPVPVPIAASVVAGALHGLHAAHEATGDGGEALAIVHRDVSPQNIVVGVDGTARVLDFGVAKAVGRLQTTREGQLKGKMAYMAVEQLRGAPVDRRTDVYAVGVVLWETLVGRKLFDGDNDVEVFGKVLDAPIEAPGRFVPDVPPELDAIVMRALAREAQDRFATARDMARAIERAVPPIAAADVGEWVERMAEKMLASRAGVVARIERSSPTSASPTVEANDAAATQVSPAPFYPSPSAIAEDAATELSSESASRPRGPVREGTRSLVLLAGIVGAAAVGICGTVLLVARGTAAGGKDSSHPPASATETPLVPAAAAVAVASAPELASASPSSSAALAPSAASGAVVPPRPAPRPGRPATNAGPLGGVLDSRK
jgi:serine/threonine-protein kinase